VGTDDRGLYCVRKMTATFELLRESTYDAVRLLRDIALDDEADKATRVRAADSSWTEHSAKRPQHLSVEVEAPWRRMMVDAIVGTLETPEVIVEGEVVEDTGQRDRRSL
jgi:hypothetical protein